MINKQLLYFSFSVWLASIIYFFYGILSVKDYTNNQQLIIFLGNVAIGSFSFIVFVFKLSRLSLWKGVLAFFSLPVIVFATLILISNLSPQRYPSVASAQTTAVEPLSNNDILTLKIN